ncbi:hypothetical protein LCGC14_1887260 [marine sediment metagenome]|uniref:Uncharacterized protein n=1 Tax=marine sediment metagenome TaxID=412755 RepID=A0A0F9G0G8_9ZZZZ
MLKKWMEVLLIIAIIIGTLEIFVLVVGLWVLGILYLLEV